MVNETLCCLLCLPRSFCGLLKEYLYTFIQYGISFLLQYHIAVALHSEIERLLQALHSCGAINSSWSKKCIPAQKYDNKQSFDTGCYHILCTHLTWH